MKILILEDCPERTKKFKQKLIGNEVVFTTTVFLEVSNLKSLRDWKAKLNIYKKRYSVFYEPDLDGQETAIACYDLGSIFKELPLAD